MKFVKRGAIATIEELPDGWFLVRVTWSPRPRTRYVCSTAAKTKREAFERLPENGRGWKRVSRKG